ncbi:MAG: DUF3037 domain-containing protein [Muribaculaceae bacterium]|nr:DUF3037 domain-containing protein [Muribaculaceae bacterium]
MQELNRYEYSVLRYVPRVEREEFVNVGLAMMCKRRRWIKVRIFLSEEKIRSLYRNADIDILSRQLQSFVDIAAGDRKSGPVAEYPVEERFRWISAVKSSVIQTSRPHPGLCEDLEATFDCLFGELVL